MSGTVSSRERYVCNGRDKPILVDRFCRWVLAKTCGKFLGLAFPATVDCGVLDVLGAISCGPERYAMMDTIDESL